MSICFRTPLLPVRFIIAIRGRNSIWNGSALKRVRARTVFPPPRRRPASVYFVFFGEAKRTNREGPSPLRSGSSSIGVLIKRVTGTGRGGGWRETYFSPGRAQKTRALRAKKKWLFLFFFPPPPHHLEGPSSVGLLSESRPKLRDERTQSNSQSVGRPATTNNELTNFSRRKFRFVRFSIFR